MNPLSILNTAIDSLWYWTYGILVGWGASFTIVVALLIILFVKIVRLNKRLNNLTDRVVTNEREMNFHIRDTQ
jgi:uncharacterized membrane protein YhiD involved in acid resistance